MKTVFRLWVALCLVTVYVASPFAASAQGVTPTPALTTATLAETSVTIPANGEAEIAFQGYCLDFGEPFPTSFGEPGSRADDDVLQVIKTALLDGSADEDPLTVNLAIWTLREGRGINDLYPNIEATIANEVNALLAKSEGTTVDPLATDRGIPLDEAIAAGQVEVTSADFAAEEDAPLAVPEDAGHPYHGEGTMTIKNLTNAEITIYYAFGTILEAQNESEQDLVTYSTELEAAATPTPAPTATAAPSATPIPTPATMPVTGAASSGGSFAPTMVIVGLGLMGLSLVGYRLRNTFS